MSQQIRKNVFETNSSSSHSLTLSKGDLVAEPFPAEVLRQGILHLCKSEYGWEWYRYYDAEEKARYLLTQIHYADIPGGNAEAVTNELRAEMPEFDMLCRVIEEHTGVVVRVIPGSSGYVDHDSQGVGRELFNDEAQLKAFLFGSTSYIETGNDNSGPGKLIATDTGNHEHYFARSYREPLKTWSQLSLTCPNKYSEEFHTESGAVLSKSQNAELLKEVRDKGTVMSVSWVNKNRWRLFEYGTPEGDTMSDLASREFFFSSGLGVTVQDILMSRDEDYREGFCRYTLHMRVPSALAKKVKALSAISAPSPDPAA